MCSSVFANDLEQVSAGWEAKGEINYRIHLNALKSLYWKHSKWDEQKFLLIFLLKLCLFFLLHLLTEYFKPEIYCFERRYYISLMDVAQNLIFITSYYIYFDGTWNSRVKKPSYGLWRRKTESSQIATSKLIYR